MRTVVFDQVLTEMVIQNLSAGELARRLGIHQDTLRRKLRGESAISLREAFAIRRALHISMPLETLFREADEG